MNPQSALQRPGFGLPLDQMPAWHRKGKQERFPHAIADFFATEGVTFREQRMLDFINQVTDKPNWWEKVHNEEILARWRSEACGNEEQQRTSSDHLSSKCFDYCVRELQDKAAYLENHDVVHVLDVDATIAKSDLDPSNSFWQSLRNTVRPLEDVPDHLRDWHPGSNGMVLDLLHPSLFPLQYGKSRVLSHGSVPLERCAEFTGSGETCPRPAAIEDDTAYSRKISWGHPAALKPWGSYQWLPSEVRFGPDGAAEITSYVNNLHPQVHSHLYKVLEQALGKAVPLWNECLSWFHDRTRLRVEGCSYEDFVAPTDPGYPHEDADAMEEEYEREDHYRNWIREHPDERMVLQPSPDEDYVPLEQRMEKDRLRRIDLRSDFPDGLQIIFKLANIHLTPDKPTYDGSNWHIEGALNEHICATALFYYDSENISDNYLEFRQHIDAEAMVMRPMQDEYEAAEALYGVKNEEAAIQWLGKVLTRPGRWIAFPNVMQHRVSRFGLEDPSKPGHRKILAMFLVDPHIKILSTANVPSQRRDWWADEVRKIDLFAGLPVELFDRVIEAVEDFPISWEAAYDTREALMAERGRVNDGYNEMLEQDTFCFCEH